MWLHRTFSCENEFHPINKLHYFDFKISKENFYYNKKKTQNFENSLRIFKEKKDPETNEIFWLVCLKELFHSNHQI